MSKENTCQSCNSDHYHSLGKSSDHFPKGKCIQCAPKQCNENCENGFYYYGTWYCRTCFPVRHELYIKYIYTTKYVRLDADMHTLSRGDAMHTLDVGNPTD